MPVRTIPRSYRNVTGRIAVAGSRSVAFESPLERDFILISQFTPGFADIEEQPVAIRLPNGRRYTPDFLVTWARRQPDLVEVKPADKVSAMADKLVPAQDYAEERGWRFLVVTDLNIRTPRLSNARFLLPFRCHTPDNRIVARLLSIVEKAGSGITLGNLIGTVDGMPRGLCLPALWHLVSTFRIAVDLDAPVTMASVAAPHSGAVPA